MTVLLGIQIHRCYAMIIADLLVSSHLSQIQKRLPTSEDITVTFPANAVRAPSGLRQKIAIIGNNLAIGWAGVYSDARSVITDLYQAHLQGKLDQDLLENRLRNSTEAQFFAYLLRDKQMDFRMLSNCTLPIEAGYFGQAIVLGSGAKDTLELLKTLLGIPSFQDEMQSGEISPQFVTAAIQKALIVTGNLLLDELLISGKPLRQLYGAGYEIVYRTPSGFRKLDSITYMFHPARIGPDGQIFVSGPVLVCAYSYTDDILSIRTCLFRGDDDGTVKLKQWAHAVGPIYRTPSEEESVRIPIPNLNSAWLCHYYIVERPNEKFAYTTIDNPASESERSLRFDELSDGSIRMVYRGNWRESVRDEPIGRVSTLGIASGCFYTGEVSADRDRRGIGEAVYRRGEVWLEVELLPSNPLEP